MAAVIALAGCTAYRGLRPQAVEGSKVPIFSWEKFGGAEGAGVGVGVSLDRITDVHYQIRIFSGETGQLVYDREGIVADGWTLDVKLPRGEYRWTVRPHFSLDGAPRVGEWMERFPGFLQARSAVLPTSIEHYPKFRIP